jgi:uncharacterized protein (UPF0332 family)
LTLENRKVHVAAELTRGQAALRAAQELWRLGLYHDAVSRAYYAALHFTLAALLTEGVEPRTHSGVSSMLGMHFIISGRLPPERAKELARLEQFRTEADYNRFFVFTPESALEELQIAERFCAELGAWLAAAGWSAGAGEAGG